MTKTTGLHDLIFKMARGDTNAQAEFDSLVREPLTRSLTREFGTDFNEEDIQEIVSHSILNMFLHVGGYRGKNGDASAWTWAYQIARNQALKWTKTKTREIHFPDSNDGLSIDEEKLYRMVHQYNPTNMPSSVEDQVIERLFREKAKEILAKLSRRERIILHLHYDKEWTFKQIADYLKISPPRVTQILKNIRKVCLAEMAKTA